MPAFFGSFIVVPIMLIARELKKDIAGFIAALVGGIAWSYYNRTMAGYYDTDMLTIVLPAFVLWGLVHAMLHHRNHWMLLLSFLMLLYRWWYPSAAPLNTAFTVILLIYTVIFERKKLYNYKLLLFMVIAITPMPLPLTLAILAGLYLYFHFAKEKGDLAVLPLLGTAAVVFVAFGGLDPVWYQVKGYLLRESVTDDSGQAQKLHFYAVSKTVREAGKIPFELFANRISGSPVTFVLAVAGYLLLAIRYRVMWLALPMLGLGFIAMKGGLRFTVYAVPVCALGLGYLFVWFAERISAFAKDARGARILRYSALTFLTLAALYPNIRHVVDYKVPTVFMKPEVQVLYDLGRKASREDYVLSWWDYGYPIRYYSDVKTLVDGGKHSGDVNFPVSFALTRPQVASANMARLDVEYTEMAYQQDRNGSYLQMMMEDYGYEDPEAFLKALNDPDFKLPRKSREVYYYLPLRMLDIFSTVAAFSAIDLESGEIRYRPFLYMTRHYKNDGDTLLLGNGIQLDKRTGMIAIGNKKVPLKAFVTATMLKNGHVETHVQQLRPEAPFYLVFMKSYGRFLLLDEFLYHSTFIQLFVLGHYDPALFEPVIVTPMAMVYRLKK
jgi:dolichyl-diphosphooligosaccharide--protein glycosyltransferase/undecaprenyl-diphosphooligosaccharide--protein glycosyltransferase